MSRRYETDFYEDRRTFRDGPRSRYYDDVDVDVRTRTDYGRDPRRSQPEFLREDYGRTNAGPLVVRERDDFDRRSRRGGEVEKEEITFRERRERAPPPPATEREVDREEFIFRRGGDERSRGPSQPPPPPTTTTRSQVVEEETDVYSRRDDRSSRAPLKSEYDEEIRIRRGSGERRSRDFDRDEFIFRRADPNRPGRDGERDEFIIRRANPPAPRPPPSREVEKEEISFRESDTRSRRGETKEELSFRETDTRSRRGGETEEDKFVFRRTEREDARSRATSRVEETDRDTVISSRTRDRSLPPPSTRRERSLPPPQLIAREREDFYVRRREPSPPPPPERFEREQIIFRHRSPSGSPPHVEREEITFRRREAPPPPRSPSPSARSAKSVKSSKNIEEEQITIRRTERSPSPPPQSPPPPALEPIIRPPIHQEIITHHRHIDHGFERARSPTPPPPPPSPPPPKEEKLEIAIRTKQGTKSNYHEEEFKFERGGGVEEDEHVSKSRGRSETRSVTTKRSQSATSHHSKAQTSTALTTTSPRNDLDDLEAEAEFYNRRAAERAFPGEAWNGATNDWAIVDVPPGTTRVRMDGKGGGSQEITWQRYNGVRRSKFLTDGEEFIEPFGRPANMGHVGPPPPRSKAPDMWTEITKDLVLKEAIDTAGYSYEETDFFFYVMEYLRYEDVLHLVELSDNIRRDRKKRIREIEWEREKMERERPRSARPGFDEHIYEREVIYDRGGGRRYR